ncbi:myxococcus cysteine-rich repeat containing protein [Nannocystis radixulma]|uniref:Myxococcus cysteine-rich repeat containing protein n=1 Tax=Nannocystis radixulma TaxID=2995305 RepID=A0ABT5BCX8_9BACT|nr:myxococcus cysteine-rich repeat containing protein [Nannocystis radixulma]MDC0671994.1 myxococcus cysteine-rich repeat containing protein [Nannocystis radixulma]
MPALIAGCLNNNVTVTTTVTDSGGDTSTATDSSGDASSSESGTEGSTTEGSTTAVSTTDAESTGDTTDSAGDSSDGTTTTGDTSTTGGDGTTDSPGEELPVCGDGVVAGAEECDDGNVFDGDGCSALCVAEPIKYAVISSHPGGSVAFSVFNLLANWLETKVTRPSLGVSKLYPAVSDRHVYVLADVGNEIHRYDMYSGEWQAWALAPAVTENTAGYLQWVGDGLCMGYWTVDFVHCHDGESWRTIDLTINPGLVSTWDPVENQLYVKTYKQFGFQVVDLDTDQIVRTILDASVTTELSFGAYAQGVFYTADGTGIYRFHSENGAKLNTMIPVVGTKHTGDFHPTNGKLYVVTDNGANVQSLIEYDPLTGAPTTLPKTFTFSSTTASLNLRFQRSAKKK